MNGQSLEPYRYQDLYCSACACVRTHRQTRKLGRKFKTTLWSGASYKCQCGTLRRAKPFASDGD